MKIFFTILFLAFISAPVKAVTDSSFRPSIQTAFFQLKVDEIQKSLLAGDGIADDKITVRSPDSANNPLTHFATEQIDSIQHLIEYSQVNSNQKVRYLRGLAEYLAS
jgi:hypothetical protein